MVTYRGQPIQYAFLLKTPRICAFHGLQLILEDFLSHEIALHIHAYSRAEFWLCGPWTDVTHRTVPPVLFGDTPLFEPDHEHVDNLPPAENFFLLPSIE